MNRVWMKIILTGQVLCLSHIVCVLDVSDSYSLHWCTRLCRWLAAVLWGEDEDLIEYADVSLDAKAPSQSAAAATASSTGPQKESDRPSTSDAPSNNDDGSTSAGDNKEGQKDPHKQEIFRLKGVLNVVGCENKYFLQGVQQLFDTFESNDAWSTCEQEKGGERVTRIVVIGRNLDKADLQRGMLRCMRDTQ